MKNPCPKTRPTLKLDLLLLIERYDWEIEIEAELNGVLVEYMLITL